MKLSSQLNVFFGYVIAPRFYNLRPRANAASFQIIRDQTSIKTRRSDKLQQTYWWRRCVGRSCCAFWNKILSSIWRSLLQNLNHPSWEVANKGLQKRYLYYIVVVSSDATCQITRRQNEHGTDHILSELGLRPSSCLLGLPWEVKRLLNSIITTSSISFLGLTLR